VVENTAMSGLLIVVRDSAGKPVPNMALEIRRPDGQLVTGNIADGNQPGTENNSPNRTSGGTYKTDANGHVHINGLDAGQYIVVPQGAGGFENDRQEYSATVTPGKLATLHITIKALGGLRLTAVDSMTKKPIYNLEYMLFDSNNRVFGTYYTNNNGRIDFPAEIPAGRYTIRMTRTASGYYLDETPKTVDFSAGRVTEIVWALTSQKGQIQILTKTGDDSEINGLPAGTPLSGAVFEAYEYKSGNMIDRFLSGPDGRAVSAPLPLGRYVVKMVQAPQWYKLSTQALDVELEFATQIVKVEFLNYAANTGVTIRKTGPAQCMPGDVIRYDIREVRNTSTVPLADFYWRDTLPVDAVRLERLVTGTYNQALKYKVMVTTSKGDARVIADNLSTTRNNVIDCSGVALGLYADEYVTSVTLVFGTVKAGFSCVEQPQIYVRTLSTLLNQYRFAKKSDVAGKYGTEWIAGNSVAVTEIYRKPVPLPKTGY
jgi:hypothetical protein